MYVLPKKMCAYVNNNPHVETWKMLSSFNNIIHLYEAVELMLEIRIVSTQCSCMSIYKANTICLIVSSAG